MSRIKTYVTQWPQFLAWCWIALFAGTSGTLAQEVQIDAKGPFYVGIPGTLSIRVVSGGEVGRADCQYVGDPQGKYEINLASTQQQVVQNLFQSPQRSSVFVFRVLANETGNLEVGPFAVSFDGKTSEIPAQTLRVQELENDPDMALSIIVEPREFYVGELVPVTVEWAIAGNRNVLEYALQNLSIRSPLFDLRIAEREQQSRTRLRIRTNGAPLPVDSVREEDRDGREYYVLSCEASLVADEATTIRGMTAQCTTERATRFARNLFGEIVVQDAVPAVATSDPFDLLIRRVPVDGRPASFSGAVGNRFSIDVTANRSVVRVGDPISLAVSVRGDGRLDQLSLPLVAGSGLVDENQFALPNEQPTGQFSGDAKQFTVQIRANSENVDQIPPIPFSWFNPIQKRFETTTSKPIAVSVRAAELIDASQVVSAAPARDSRPGQTDQDGSRSATSNVAFQGANLAIETNLALLMTPHSILLQGWGQPAVYTFAGLLVFLALLKNWRGRAISDSPSHTDQVERVQNDIASLDISDGRNAASKVATALRSILELCGDADRKRAEALIGQCEAIQYSPDGTPALPQSLLDDSRALLKEIGKQ